MMNNMATMGGKMNGGFGGYGRYPTLPGYVLAASGGAAGASSASSGGYSNYADAVQTDTPPQTPPNLKVNSSVATPSGLLSHPYASPSVHHRAAALASVASDSAAPSSAGGVDQASTAFRPIYRT